MSRKQPKVARLTYSEACKQRMEVSCSPVSTQSRYIQNSQVHSLMWQFLFLSQKPCVWLPSKYIGSLQCIVFNGVARIVLSLLHKHIFSFVLCRSFVVVQDICRKSFLAGDERLPAASPLRRDPASFASY